MPGLFRLCWIACGLFGSAFWIFSLVDWLRHRHGLVRLIDRPDEPPEGGWPRLAVAFAARDEAPAVETATRSLLAQDYPALEVIAVDDRSSDATGAILDRLAAQDARLRVIHIDTLPPGWLGKTHALQGASDATDAPWLLMTDADVIFAPTALRRAVGHAIRTGADHLVVTPMMPTETIGERLFLAMFYAAFAVANPPWRVEDPDRHAHLGIGAFNLVRHERFRDIAGFRRLALSVDDDMRLGQALKAAGGQPRVALGDGLLSVKWQTGLWGLIRGLEKNFFAGVGFRLVNTLVLVPLVLVVGAGPAAVLAAGGPGLAILGAAAIVGAGAAIEIYGRVNGIRGYYALTLPISAALFAFALARSTWLTLARGGVVWRGHLYPLAELRAHVRQRDAWLREVWRSTR